MATDAPAARSGSRASRLATALWLFVVLLASFSALPARAHHPQTAASVSADVPAVAFRVDDAPLHAPSLRDGCPGRSSPLCGCGTAVVGLVGAQDNVVVANGESRTTLGRDIADSIVRPQSSVRARVRASGSLGARAPPLSSTSI